MGLASRLNRLERMVSGGTCSMCGLPRDVKRRREALPALVRRVDEGADPPPDPDPCLSCGLPVANVLNIILPAELVGAIEGIGEPWWGDNRERET